MHPAQTDPAGDGAERRGVYLRSSVPVDTIEMLVVRAKVVFVDGATHTELVIDVLELFDAVANLRVPLQLLVHDFFVLHPSVRLLIVDVVGSVFLLPHNAYKLDHSQKTEDRQTMLSLSQDGRQKGFEIKNTYS